MIITDKDITTAIKVIFAVVMIGLNGLILYNQYQTYQSLTVCERASNESTTGNN